MIRHCALVAVVIALSVGSAGTDAYAQPARAANAKLTQDVTGVVLAEDRAPIRRALIRLSRTGGDSKPVMVLSDASGLFRFAGLRAGAYVLSVTKAAYVLRSASLEPVTGGLALQISDAQAPTPVSVVLQRGGVIAGEVFDEFGDPVSGVAVRLLQARIEAGRRQLVPLSNAVTNDIGEFRLFGLSAGHFYVSAAPRVPLGGSSASGPSFPPTYYPSSTDPSAAEALKVTPGQTITGIAIVVNSSRWSRLSGRTVDSRGRAWKSAVLELVGGLSASRLRLGIGQSGANGEFSIARVPPGEYQIVAQGSQEADGQRISASIPVAVDGDSVSGLRMVGVPWGRIGGDWVARLPQTNTLRSISLRIVRVDPNDPFSMVEGVEMVRANGKFEITAPAGRVLVRGKNLAPEWLIEHVRIGDLEVTDRPFELAPGALLSNAQVVLTNTAARVEGIVTRQDGAPAADAAVIVFPADPTRRAWYSRGLHLTRAGEDGRYLTPALPPGEYRVCAIEHVAAGEESDPDLLSLLDKFATRVTVGETGRQQSDLNLVRPR